MSLFYIISLSTDHDLVIFGLVSLVVDSDSFAVLCGIFMPRKTQRKHCYVITTKHMTPSLSHWAAEVILSV
jgi:hypothetical protein